MKKEGKTMVCGEYAFSFFLLPTFLFFLHIFFSLSLFLLELFIIGYCYFVTKNMQNDELFCRALVCCMAYTLHSFLSPTTIMKEIPEHNFETPK